MEFARDIAALFILEALNAGGEFRVFLFRCEIGDENAGYRSVTRESSKRQTLSESAVVRFAETHLAFASLDLSSFQKLLQHRNIIRVNEVFEASTEVTECSQGAQQTPRCRETPSKLADGGFDS